MSAITPQDLQNCALTTLANCDDTPPPVPHHTITESELWWDERIVPVYTPPPDTVFPTTELSTLFDDYLLAVENTDTTPLCLKPPTMMCHKRFCEEHRVASARDESTTSLAHGTVPTEERLPWINWVSRE